VTGFVQSNTEQSATLWNVSVMWLDVYLGYVRASVSLIHHAGVPSTVSFFHGAYTCACGVGDVADPRKVVC
jgi:hypothetical protein